MAPVLNEQSLRRFAALEAKALGHGGVRLMSGIKPGVSDDRPAWRLSLEPTMWVKTTAAGT
jgi:hypothetical protein